MIVFGLAQLGVRHPHLLTLRLGFHASATLSRSGWFIEPGPVRADDPAQRGAE
jgi:hypothetical protein